MSTGTTPDVGSGGGDGGGQRDNLPTTSSMTPLVIDALNKLTSYFLPIDSAPKKTSAWGLLAAMQGRIKGFLSACEVSRLAPHFVIDAGWASAEAATKWKKRRVGSALRGMSA
jgi:hypothetical protein